MTTQHETDRVDQLAADIASLKRAEGIRAGRIQLTDPASYFQNIASEQSRRFLIRRERAERGHLARERFASKNAGRRHKIEDRLAKIERERLGALEKHDATRRDLIEHYATLAQKPQAELAALRDEADRAGTQAEAQPIDIQAPRVRLGRDDSDLEKTASKDARTVGQWPKSATETWGRR